MYQKFVITDDGVMRLGCVYLHRDLLADGEYCTHGGGLWKVDRRRGALLLYGRSFDFGTPELAYVSRIDWHGAGLEPMPVFFLPHWPDETQLVPVNV